MTTRGKKVAIGWALAAGFLLAAAVSFGHEGRRGGEGPGMFCGLPERAMDALGITGEQKTQVQEVFRKYRPQAEPLVKNLVTERRALRRLIRDGAADEAAVRAQSARVAAVESDLAVLRAKGSREFRALLTKEQAERLAKFEEKREKRADRFLEKGCGEPNREKR